MVVSTISFIVAIVFLIIAIKQRINIKNIKKKFDLARKLEEKGYSNFEAIEVSEYIIKKENKEMIKNLLEMDYSIDEAIELNKIINFKKKDDNIC